MKQRETLGIFNFGVFTQPVKISRRMRSGEGRIESVKMEKQVTTYASCEVHGVIVFTHAWSNEYRDTQRVKKCLRWEMLVACEGGEVGEAVRCRLNRCTRSRTKLTSLLASPSLLIPFSLLHSVFALKFLQVV